MSPNPVTQHSTDGAWWWDGERWLPAWTPDHRYWFDGLTWRASARQWSRRAKRLLVGWLGTLFLIFVSAWTLVGLRSSNKAAWAAALAVTAGLSFATGIAAGYALGRDGLGRGVPLAALAATAVLLGCYGASFIFVSGDTNSDNEAGAGVALFMVPTFVLTLLVLGLGWLPGSMVRRRKARPAE